MKTCRIKRIYEPADAEDGYRVLVDRVWPRGISKERAALDQWCRDVAPSNELRQWFNHEPERFEEFAVRYEAELEANVAVSDLVALLSKETVVTLLYGAHDEQHNQAVVLQRYLQK